jgi:demethylmenaquinone methyltransferase/2-methoxy-6-polyprenyl-1,4-benzoquinol methylase
MPAATAPDPRAPDKGRAVRGMFTSIAPRYDLLNRLLSAGQDQRWRRALVARLPPLREGDRVLDLCTGTGDVALAIASGPGARAAVHASDFCEAMVARAPDKARRRAAGHPPAFLVADALALPYPGARFRAVTVAFGLRNIQDPPAALAEMARVLEPGGRLLILEFSRPENRAFARLYRLYFFQVLPRLGRLLSGSPVDAYRYLPESVWAFPGPDELATALRRAGLAVLEQKRFLGGAVVLHVSERPGPERAS